MCIAARRSAPAAALAGGEGQVAVAVRLTLDERHRPRGGRAAVAFSDLADLTLGAAVGAVGRIAVATGELVAPSTPPWDDCFVNTGPVTLVYDREVAPELTVSSDCDHWVVYDEPATATCVEPQSGPPDSPNIRPRLVIPGEPLLRTMTLTW